MGQSNDERLTALTQRIDDLEEETGALWLLVRVLAQRQASDGAPDLTDAVKACAAATTDYPVRNRCFVDLIETIRKNPTI